MKLEREGAKLCIRSHRPGLSMYVILIAVECQWNILSRIVEGYHNCFKNKQLVENSGKAGMNAGN